MYPRKQKRNIESINVVIKTTIKLKGIPLISFLYSWSLVTTTMQASISIMTMTIDIKMPHKDVATKIPCLLGCAKDLMMVTSCMFRMKIKNITPQKMGSKSIMYINFLSPL